MTVILMTQDAGSRGEEVALLVAERLGMELVRRQRLERCLAERLRLAERSVQRVFGGRASLLERWLVGEDRLGRCLADEVATLAVKGDVLIETASVTPLRWCIKRAVCIHIAGAARPAVQVGKLCGRPRAPRAHTHPCGIERVTFRWGGCGRPPANQQRYDLVLNPAHVPIEQCVEQVRLLVEHPRFLRDPAPGVVLTRRSHEAAAERCAGEVIVDTSRLTLTGGADSEQAIARIEEHLRRHRQSSVTRLYPLPPTSPIG